MKLNKLTILFLVIAMLGLYVFAQEEASNPVADVLLDASGIAFAPVVSYDGLSLSVSTPTGEVFAKRFDSGQSPYISLADFGTSFVDGLYTYELRTLPRTMPRTEDNKKNAFGPYIPEPITQTGYFRVLGGAIITSDFLESGGSGSMSTVSGGDGLAAIMAQVIATDLIVQGSECVGVDCSGSESFGFDTMRLKENNLRIHFDDTSSSGSFPKNDWRIIINDSSNGGAEYFAVQDATASKNVFVVEAGADANSLYVDDGGKVGLGTSTPAVNLHVKEGNTPTLRLEQDGSSGFTPQTWDVAGNEANFFVRDVTNGSKLSFRIQPGAPESSLSIMSSGNIGVGTWSPDYPFEVERTGTGAQMVATRTDGAQMEISASGSYGIAGTKSAHPLRLRVEDTWIVQINKTGKYIDMTDGGYYDGNWVGSSSRKLKENIVDLTAEDAVKAVMGLTPVRYNYKKNKAEEHVGFIAEDVPELVAQSDRKGLSPLDIVGALTKVVQEQQKLVTEQQSTIEELKYEIRDLKQKLDR